MRYMVVFIFLLLSAVPSYAATTVSVASQGSPGAGVCSITRSFSQTDMAAWHTTALTLVPTPNTGLTVFPITVTASYDPATTRYTFSVGPTIELRLGNVTFKSIDNFSTIFAATPAYPHVLQTLIASTNNGNIDPFVGAASSAKTTALSLVNVSGTAITGGDGNVIISVQYYLLNTDGTISGQCVGTSASAPDGVTIGVGGNVGSPVSGETGTGDVDVAFHTNTGSTGSVANPWSGWEVILATNRDGAVCTTPAGYSVPTCLWPAGKKYYFRTGNYYQVYPVAFIGINAQGQPDNTVVPQNLGLEGAGALLTSIKFNPVNDGQSQFTFGQLGKHARNIFVRNLTLLGYMGNAFTKVGIHTIDVSWVYIEGNIINTLCGGFGGGANSRGIWIQGREFNWINNNQVIAHFPFYLEGQPVVADGGASDGNPFNNVGYSRFNNNEFIVCDWVNPNIYIGATTILNDVVFSGNSTIFGSDNLKWVQDFTGIADSNRKAVSHNVVIENFDWEQTANDGSIVPGDLGKTGNGWFVHIDQSNGNAYGLTGLTIRDSHYGSFIGLAAGYTINGVRLLNVHDVVISGLHQALGAAVCGYVLDLTNVHNVMVTGMEVLPLPSSPAEVVAQCTGSPNFIADQIGLVGSVCKTWAVPLSEAHGGKNTNIPSAALYDIPASGGSCL